MANEKEAVAISDYLHTLDVTQPLAYYMARGLSVKLAQIVVDAQVRDEVCRECGKDYSHYTGCSLAKGE